MVKPRFTSWPWVCSTMPTAVGAFALSRATGYRVLSKHRKGGDILTCGFPANQLDMVLQRIRDAGGEVEQAGEKTFLYFEKTNFLLIFYF